MELKRKIALVTGGSRGIGKAIVLELAKTGVEVAIGYNKRKEFAEEVRNEVHLLGRKAVIFKADIASVFSINKAVSRMRKVLGSVDILINNAAISQEKNFASITVKDWDCMLTVNLRSAFILCQKVLPYMKKKRWGRIINISSLGGQWGGFNQVHYAAAKAGLINLTKSLARIYSKFGITVNAVAPGLVLTDMARKELMTTSGKRKVKDIPLGRIATSDEVATVVSFLCSKEASYITGQTINVNGGMYFG